MIKWIVSTYSTLLSIGLWISALVMIILFTIALDTALNNWFLSLIISIPVALIISAIIFGAFFVIIDMRNALRSIERNSSSRL